MDGPATRWSWLALFFFSLLGVACGSDALTRPPDNEEETKGYDRVTATYPSSVVGGDRPLVILLPSDYEDLTDLPVLYLLHGWGGDETDWTSQGFAQITLSNRYRDGTIGPMLVVMPDNILGESALTDGPDTDPFLREIREDIIPFVEGNYRVASRRSARAIAGLSAGGIQTLNLTLFYPELWSYSNPMSAAYFADALPRLRGEYAESLQNPAINQLELFELAIGTEDFLFYNDNSAMRDVFDEFGIAYTYYESQDGHTWEFWRACLNRLLPLLFRD